MQKKVVSSREGVIATNWDAIESKWCAIRKGYYSDAALEAFLDSYSKLIHSNSYLNSIRAPFINRGTYTRIHSIERIVFAFLTQTFKANPHATRQIISLGAGFDTLYFRIISNSMYKDLDYALFNPIRDRYIEIDLPEVANAKAQTVSMSQKLMKLVPNAKFCANGSENRENSKDNSQFVYVSTENNSYTLLGMDLRNPSELETVLFQFHEDSVRENVSLEKQENVWTLVISELMLIYMKPEESDALIESLCRGLSQQCSGVDGDGMLASRVGWLNLEHVSPHDPFGSMMMKNLNARKCGLLGIEKYPSIERQNERFVQFGLGISKGWTLLEEFESHIEESERKRIEKLEFLDELEEWKLIMSHYAVIFSGLTALQSE